MDYAENLNATDHMDSVNKDREPSDKLLVNAANFSNMEHLLMRICTLLEMQHRSAAKEREKTEEDDDTKRDWILAAAVVDRMLFLTFSILFIGGTIMFFMIFYFGP